MPRFFCPQPVAPEATFALDVDVAQHVRVLRLREGDGIVLFDGAGGETPATIVSIGKREVTVATGQHLDVEREAARQVTVYAGLIANDRMDWMIQKATELGVAAIQPIYTDRSQRIPGDIAKRVDHWRAVAIAACEQCGRNRIPNVHAPQRLVEALAGTQGATNALLDADGEHGCSPGTDAMNVFIGPEGGFAPHERDALLAHCGHKLRIGATVLRAETAAVAAMALLGSP
ncbi:MAG: 16S rRNA (uracil(1498)-N(3))-methyltransferase [Burkholderiales bacterium]|nr:16S rRNA (uracil(1498)-N(3))-methyltransferase [Burkholderiales bacterium]